MICRDCSRTLAAGQWGYVLHFCNGRLVAHTRKVVS